MLIAGPNLTTDRTLRIDELRPGEVLWFSTATITPGGKGVNVARVAGGMGFPAVLVALAAGRTGTAAAELLRDEGLDIVPVKTGGEVRAASVILEDIASVPGRRGEHGLCTRHGGRVMRTLGIDRAAPSAAADGARSG
jgi:fructose-1-phosphate kinase PfkB-like protein